MKKYLDAHAAFMKKNLSRKMNKEEMRQVLEIHRARIGFLQHERLIHLLITLFFGMIVIILFLSGVIYQYPEMIVVMFLMMFMLLAYVYHYFQLENGVQKLYGMDNLLVEKLRKKERMKN